MENNIKDKPDIKIAVVTQKPFNIPDNKCFIPINSGRVLADKYSKSSADYRWLIENTVGDDSEDNISEKNPYYCELTALYWLWKNKSADYMGLCHYRRYMCFSDYISGEYAFAEHKHGCLTTEYISNENLSSYGLDEASLRDAIAGYDAVFIKPIALEKSNVNSNYAAMEACPDYHVMKDVDLMIDVVCKKYPEMAHIVEEYMFNYNYSFLYNCFIFKREVFDTFCSWLFDILFTIEPLIDFSCYSTRQSRCLGLLGERLIGIWFLWMKKHSQYRIKNVPLLFVEDSGVGETLSPAFSDNNIVIASNFNNNYVPIFGVFLESLLDNISSENNYDIIVLSADLSETSKELLLETVKGYKNVSLRFYNPAWLLNGIDLTCDFYGVYSKDLYYRVVIPYALVNYDKVLVVDADMICREDIAALYNEELDGYLAGGVKDTVYQGLVNFVDPNMKKYALEYMKITKMYDYINTGVLLFNCSEYRRKYPLDYLVLFIAKHISKVKIFEQDMLNMLLYGGVKFLNQRWNIYTRTNDWVKKCLDAAPYKSVLEYELARKNEGGIVHYANIPKPWTDPLSDKASLWWKCAHKSVFYDEILKRMSYKICSDEMESRCAYLLDKTADLVGWKENILNILNWKKYVLKYWKYKILRNFTFGKTRERYIYKKHLYKDKIRNARQYVKQ